MPIYRSSPAPCTRPQCCGEVASDGRCARCCRCPDRSGINPYTGVRDQKQKDRDIIYSEAPGTCQVCHIVDPSGTCLHCGKQFPNADADQKEFNARLIIALKESAVEYALWDSVRHAINTGHLRT